MSERVREYVGSVVIDEVPMRITRIYMMGGFIHLDAVAFGPLPAHTEGVTDVEFLGLDGKSIGSLRLSVPEWPVTGAGSSVTVLLRARLSYLEEGE